MLANAVQGIAEDYGAAQVGVEEWLYAKMIPRDKEALAWPVPHGECEIAEQMFDTSFSPRPVSSKQQLDISSPALDVFASSIELRNQVRLRVYACVGDDAHM